MSFAACVMFSCRGMIDAGAYDKNGCAGCVCLGFDRDGPCLQGVLNVWHLVHYQRFYNSLVAQLVPSAEEANQSLVARVLLPFSI